DSSSQEVTANFLALYSYSRGLVSPWFWCSCVPDRTSGSLRLIEFAWLLSFNYVRGKGFPTKGAGEGLRK
ncbi:MAG: hypothetical protein QNL71_12420, partial [Akkermansiaceae bacterium]